MTLFEKIAARQIPADIVYEDEHTIAFRDLHPVAPIHVLVTPRLPLPGLSSAGTEHIEVLGHCLNAARRVAAQLGLEPGGYRVVINNGDDAGQTVPHLHLHLLGGRQMSWPPG
ncbi:MAG: histidine triad nucleotide-binding protein [Myxococcales bacterium]|nr:histidine triad nucleotide-binding protein [Myxococcales bacterium]